MDSYKHRLAAALRERESAFVEMVSHETRGGEGPKYPPEAIAQMVRGFFKMLDETIVGGDSELRTFYFDSVMPSLRDSGSSLTMMVPGTARVLAMIAMDAISLLPEGDRPEASRWFGEFIESYIRQIIELWEQKPST